MKVLVTGGAGYIGGFTTRRLLARGHQVTVLDNLSAGHRQAIPPGCLVVGDLGDPAVLDRAFAGGVEAVVHFAASCYVGESVTDPAKYYANNTVNSLALLDAVRRHRVGRFLFSSTCAVYGTPTRLPLAEDHPRSPVNPYGNSKLAVELAVADFAAAFGFGYTALRYFNAAGAAADASHGEDHAPETHLIPLVLQAVAGRRERVDVFGTDYPTPDGTCVRDYVHVEDLAEAHALALEQTAPGTRAVFNVGTGRGYSVREVIAAAERVTGKRVPARDCPRRPGDPAELVAAGDHIRTVLGWRPVHSDLEHIVATAWRWQSTHPNGYD
jgi:UDP-glucose 4-epimerase